MSMPISARHRWTQTVTASMYDGPHGARHSPTFTSYCLLTGGQYLASVCVYMYATKRCRAGWQALPAAKTRPHARPLPKQQPCT
eukprot:3314052-Lingulodinium_polyedra.AAC.1